MANEHCTIQNQRFAALDAARGFTIILVVVGHSRLATIHDLKWWIYSFHMPFFFLASGLVSSRDQKPLTATARRFRKLVVPYALILCSLAAAKLLTGGDFTSFIGRLSGILYGTGQTIDWAPLWFLPHFFACTVLFQVTLSRMVNPRHLLALGLGCIVAGEISIRQQYPLPWSLDISIYTTGLMITAYSRRSQIESPHLMIFALLVFTCLLLVRPANPSVFDLNRRSIPIPCISTLIAVTGSLLVLETMKRVPVWASNILEFVGKHSLAILLFHHPIQANCTLRMMKAGFGTTTSIFIAFVLATTLPTILAITIGNLFSRVKAKYEE